MTESAKALTRSPLVVAPAGAAAAAGRQQRRLPGLVRWCAYRP
jgi:hypothetical protein